MCVIYPNNFSHIRTFGGELSINFSVFSTLEALTSLAMSSIKLVFKHEILLVLIYRNSGNFLENSNLPKFLNFQTFNVV